MCYVWISEQTAIISLYSINWLVFITETECVYCAVRTESWNVIHTTLQAQAVSRRRVTAEARVRSQASPGGICGGHSVNGTGFSPSTSAFSCQCIVTNAQYSSTCFFDQKDKRAKLGNLLKEQSCFGSRGAVDCKVLLLFCFSWLKILYVGYTVEGVVRGENSVMQLFIRALLGRS
jgi:hypothetical protein